MWHRDAALFRGVLELLVTADLVYFVPAVPLQRFDHVPAVHPLSYPAKSMIHTFYTPVHVSIRTQYTPFWDFSD
jgi:hypothetical protein